MINRTEPKEQWLVLGFRLRGAIVPTSPSWSSQIPWTCDILQGNSETIGAKENSRGS